MTAGLAAAGLRLTVRRHMHGTGSEPFVVGTSASSELSSKVQSDLPQYRRHPRAHNNRLRDTPTGSSFDLIRPSSRSTPRLGTNCRSSSRRSIPYGGYIGFRTREVAVADSARASKCWKVPPDGARPGSNLPTMLR